MKIKKIILENFKFYTNQNLDTRNKNILLYGENGAGKSSLYWALHLFYKTIFSSNQQFFLDKLDQTKSDNLVNHNLNLDAQLTIETNNDSINITKTNISNHSISTDSYKTFHFLNHQKLSDLLINNYNIYNTIQNDFFGKYILFDELKIILDDTIQNINTTQDTTNLNQKLNEVLINISRRVNILLKRVFKEKLILSFEIDEPFLINIDVADNKTLLIPIIYIKINDKKDFHLRINEARIKIIAISIYLSLFIHNEKSYENIPLLKLIVLDDILLSLDMSQRTKILKFIFKMFYDKYQFFIFTHDIYFYDLVKKIIKYQENLEDFNQTTWINNVVFSKLNHSNFSEPIIYTAQDNYLNDAEFFLGQNNLSECGNNIRKEIEKIVKSMLIDFEIGKQGELYHKIKVFTNLQNKNLYKESHKNLDEIFSKIHDPNLTDQEKIRDICQIYTSCIEISLTKLNNILKDFQWHRDLIGNSSSHANLISQYKPEFAQAIDDVKKIKSLYKESIKI